MAKLRTVSGHARVSHSVPTVGEKINAKTATGRDRIMPAGSWTYIALCGADTSKGFDVEGLAQKTTACKKCLKVIDRLYGS